MFSQSLEAYKSQATLYNVEKSRQEASDPIQSGRKCHLVSTLLFVDNCVS